MPPQQSQQQDQPTLPSGPNGSLDPEYNFIFQDKKKPKFHFHVGLPSGNNFIRNIALIVGTGIVLMIIIIVLANVFLGSRGVNSKQLVDVMAHAQEIARVSDLVSQQQSNADINTLNLSATTSNALNSEQAQLTSYLHSMRIKKISTKDLDVYLNKSTDTQLQTAAQNNNLSTTYYSYLKTQLAAYENSIKTAYNSSGPKAKQILQSASASTQTLLASPQLASATAQ